MSSETEASRRRCKSCGRELPPNATEGLCPVCLLRAGLETFSVNESQLAETFVTDPSGQPELHWEGTQRGDYLVGRLLGRGGMGDVYEANHVPTGRLVALKVLRQRFGFAERERFLREGQIAASISHPRTVFVFAAEELEGVPVIAMELLPGGTLKDRVNAFGPLRPAEAAGAVIDIVSGLEAARVAGILHRDVKPSNCFLDNDGSVRIGDFGISLSTLGRDVASERASTGFQGTPHFAAPEQLRGEPLDVRADIYAVGATLYYLLAGQPPYDGGGDLHQLIARVTDDPVPSPRSLRSEVPSGLAALTIRCLSKAPSERPQSYAVIAEALRPFALTDQQAPRLGVRILAGLVDNLLIGVPLALVDMLRAFAGAGDPPGATLNGVVRAAWVVLALYYALLEGATGASIGKRVFGLRLGSATGPPAPSRVLLRTAIFAAPSVVLFTYRLWHGPISVFATGSLPAALERPVMGLTLVALLFVTARPGNGWSGIHDLASATWVAARSASPRRRVRQLSSLPRVTDGHQRLGPFEVIQDLGGTDRGVLIHAYDSVLRRDVWIHRVSSETPPASPARRNVSRITRLHWLMGPRADTAWDAFDAPAGRPLLGVIDPIDWPTLRGWLTDLSDELTLADQDDTLANATLAHVWVRDDGHVTLLDFPYPTADQAAAAAVRLRLIELLPAVATYVTMRAPSSGQYPLALLQRMVEWAETPPTSTQALRAQVTALGQTADAVTSVRRALPMLFPLVPILAVTLAGLAATPAMLTMRTFEHANMLWWLDALRAPAPEGRLQDPDVRRTAERYVVARFRASLSDETFWKTVTAQPVQQVARHDLARQLLERHGQNAGDLDALTAEMSPEVARADRESHAVADRAGGFVGIVVSSGLALVIVVLMIAHLVSAAVVPGGVVMRAAGSALVTSNGHEANRLRSIGRALLAWSPVLVWCLALAVASRGADYVPLPRWPMLGAVLTCGALGLGAIATVLHPSRGPHDVLAKVWVVPR